MVLNGIRKILLLGWLLIWPGVACAADVAAATAAVAATQPDTDAEARAMSAVIAAARGSAPAAPADAVSNAVAAEAAASAASTPADFAAAAHTMSLAARAAPWVAEYHFKRGGYLAKANLSAAAARAFTLYLQAAPAARDAGQVRALIAALQQHPEPAARSAGAEFRDCPKCTEIVVIPAGRNIMGSPAQEKRRF